MSSESNTTTFGQLDSKTPESTDIFAVQALDGKNYNFSVNDLSVFIGGGGGGNINSINGDTTSAQVFLAGTGLVIINAGANHTYTIGNHTHQDAANGDPLVATLALTATGTKDSTTFLRGDDTWAVPPGGGAGITTINGDPSAAQTMAAGTGLQIAEAGATHTYSIDSTVVTLTGTQILQNKTIDDANNLITGIFGITGLATQVQDLNMGNFLIKAVGSPVDGTDAANKTYVDNLVNGLSWKNPAVVATTGNITLSGNQTIDGTLTITGDRVLVKDQTSGAENGVYESDTGAWSRTTDADSESDLLNMSIYISKGSMNADTSWVLTTDAPIIVDTTVLTYAQIGAGTGNPLTTKGDIFGYDTANARIPVGTNGQVLEADSAEALGVKWATPAGGSPNFIEQLNTRIIVTDTGSDGLADFILDGVSKMQMDIDKTQMATRFELVKASTISNISSSVATLNNEGNLFDFNNTVATFNSINSTNWQAGSVIYLQFTAATGGITLVHNFAASNPQEPFWLLNETNYIVDSTNNNQILQFIYDGTYWVQQSFGEIAAGGSQTPITQDIVYAGFDISDLSILEFRAPATADPGQSNSISIQDDGGVDNMVFHVNDVSGEFDFITDTNSVPTVTIDSNGITMIGKILFGPQRITGTDLLRIVTFETTASAVNYFNMKGATAGNGPTLETDGSDANIDMILTPKGNSDGSVLINSRALKMVETTTKTVPTAGRAKFYPKDNGGRSAFFIQDDVGETEFALISQAQTFEDKTLGTGTIVNIPITWNEFRQTFNPNATLSGLNVGAHTAEPSVPVAGDIFYDSTANQFKGRTNVAWIDLGAGGASGDVVGPASSTDQAITLFDGVTGKLIKNSDLNYDFATTKQLTLPGPLILSAAGTVPAGTNTYLREVTSDLVVNVNAANSILFNFGTANNYDFDATQADFKGNNLVNALLTSASSLVGTTVTSGLAYNNGIKQTFNPSTSNAGLNVGAEASNPSSPVNGDIFYDSVLNKFKAYENGSWVDLVAGTEFTTWTADHNQAGFDLVGKATAGVTLGQGATNLYSITFIDDTVDAGIRIGNTDGFVSIKNKSAVVGDNQMEFLMESGGATTIRNIMLFQVPVADDSGTEPVLEMNFQDGAGGALTRPLMTINHLSTELVKIFPSTDWEFHTSTSLLNMARISFPNVTTTEAADRVVNLDAADKITWDGAAAATPNYITFTDGDIFQVFINNALQFQLTDTSANFLNGLIQGVAGYEFQVGTSDIVGTSTDLELNGPTNVSIHIADTQKFFFNTSFLDMGNLHIKNLNSIRDVITGTPIQLKFEGVTSAVNYLEIVNAISAEGPTLSANGTATNIDLNLATKGTGNITLNDYTVADTNVQLKYGGTVASAASMSSFREGNFYDVTGTTTINFLVDDLFFQAGHFITFQFDAAATLTHNAASPPTNFAVMLLKGNVDFVATAGDLITLVFNGLEWEEVSRSSTTTPGMILESTTVVDLNGSNMVGVQDIVHNQSAITYNATLAFDFDVNQEQTLAVTGDLTTLTTANRGAGKSKTIFITGDTVNRTLTFNTSWKTNPNTATVSINANTFGLLTFGCKGAAETDVFCAYAEFS